MGRSISVQIEVNAPNDVSDDDLVDVVNFMLVRETGYTMEDLPDLSSITWERAVKT